MGEKLERRHREKDSQKTAGQAEQETLAQELAHQPPSSGAERHAHSHLLPPFGCPGEQQIRQIRAGNQEDKADCAKQDDQHAAAGTDEVVTHGCDEGAHSLAPLCTADSRSPSSADSTIID
jgi:hypothetical protein